MIPVLRRITSHISNYSDTSHTTHRTHDTQQLRHANGRRRRSYCRFSSVLVNRRGPIGVGLPWPRLIDPSLLTVTGSAGVDATCSHGQSQYSGSQPPAVSIWPPSAARQTESHQSSVKRSE